MQLILDFLTKLGENNNKEWFSANKHLYTKANEEFKTLASKIHEELSKFDLLEAPKTFRIYRDVRFSADKSPYKRNMGVHIARATKLRRGGYYLHVEPGASFIGGGFWQPEPHDLKRIRDEFAADPHSIQKVIQSPDFQQYFHHLSGEKLTRPPKGYDSQLPAIDLIKHKSFVASKPLSDAELLNPDFHILAADVFRTMIPFHDYMSTVLTTNLNGELIV